MIISLDDTQSKNRLEIEAETIAEGFYLGELYESANGLSFSHVKKGDGIVLYVPTSIEFNDSSMRKIGDNNG